MNGTAVYVQSETDAIMLVHVNNILISSDADVAKDVFAIMSTRFDIQHTFLSGAGMREREVRRMHPHKEETPMRISRRTYACQPITQGTRRNSKINKCLRKNLQIL